MSSIRLDNHLKWLRWAVGFAGRLASLGDWLRRAVGFAGEF
ncbi:hypothetical protein [Novipirellula sp.]